MTANYTTYQGTVLDNINPDKTIESLDSLLSLYNEISFSFDEKVSSSLLKLNKADKNIKIPLKKNFQ